MTKIEKLDHIALVVSDLDKSVEWYQDIFGLVPKYEKEWWSDKEKFLGAGDTIVAFFQSESDEGEPLNKNPKGCHHAFRTNRDSFESYKDRLTEKGIEFRFVDHGGVTHSIYFSDPDGYHCEITTYEV